MTLPIEIAQAASTAASEVQGMGALHVGVHVVEQLIDQGLIAVVDQPPPDPADAPLSLFDVAKYPTPINSWSATWGSCECSERGYNDWWRCPLHGKNV